MANLVPVSEQFIQDIVSHKNYLHQMLKDLQKEDWCFVSHEQNGDVINQEYTVRGGRIDVLATFGGMTKLLIVEVKAGTADFAAVEQLKWYINPEQVDELKRDDKLHKVNEVLGVLVAQDFWGIPRERVPENIHLFRCTLRDADSKPLLEYVRPHDLRHRRLPKMRRRPPRGVHS